MGYNGPGETKTEEYWRAAAAGFMDEADDVRCTVDGEPSAISYPTVRVQSPRFGFTVPEVNIFDSPETPFPAGRYDLAVSDGYWVMLPPLPAGPHEIHFYAAIPEWEVVQDVTYNITVVGDGGGNE